MPKYRITTPEGEKFEITAPEGASESQALDYFKQNYKPTAKSTSTPKEKEFGEKAIEFAEPIVSGLGAALGTFAGTELGPPGMIGGGALGYGAGKELTHLAKQYMGYEKPRTGAEQITQPLKNVAEGATGMVVPAAVGAGLKALSKAPEVASRLLPGATAKAQSAIKDIGKATDISTLGRNIEDFLSKRLGMSKSFRGAQAERNYGQFFEQGAGKEPQIVQEYQNYIAKVMGKAGDLSPNEQRLIAQSNEIINSNPSIVGIEKEIRRLKDISQQPKTVTGYDSIVSNQAGKLAQELEKTVNRLVPKAAKAREAYEQASKLPNLYEKVFGKGAAEELVKDPASLPKKLFSTKDSLQTFRDVAKNDRFVEQAARDHVASELKGLNAEQAAKWYRDNKIWLEDLPKINGEAIQYLKNLQAVKSTQKTALKTAAGLAALGGASAGYSKLSSLLGL
jgi:hypothetical protein